MRVYNAKCNFTWLNPVIEYLKMKTNKEISKFLSLVLRHSPQTIHLKLDSAGWASIPELLKRVPFKLNMDKLKEIVETNDKQRFSFNTDYTKIRANQGHSVSYINLELEAIKPPEILYHGTVSKFVSSIKAEGLRKMSRQHVHLSADRATAVTVGSRRGVPIILSVCAGKMYDDNISFYKSENGVWLTEEVPAEYIIFKS